MTGQAVAALAVVLAAVIPPSPKIVAEEAPEEALVFSTVEFKGHSIDLVRIDLNAARLDLFWKRPDGERFGSFGNVREWAAGQGRVLRFATNAGIFTPEFAPAGLHIEDGQELRALNTRTEGYGNFHLMPNGVFYIDDAGAHAVTTDVYADTQPTPRIATQSGPMLVVDGELHDAFNEGSDNVRRRSGVGVVSDHEIVFAVSKLPINFFDFATLFKDELGCANALYLDGDISLMYAPEAGKAFEGGLYAGILAVVEDDTAPAEEPVTEGTNP